MKILQTVVVKQVLTEKSKKELLKKFEENISQLQKEFDQLQFEQKRFEKQSKTLTKNVRDHFNRETQARHEKIKLISFQIEQLKLLPLGSEIKEREVQAISEIKVGDNWEQNWSRSEIVIKDGIVQEIR
ncbi:YlqD family protein [Neobacillus sp. D3-1R]|uniref:YlqD family protein n=1 Tax=Neobacillus sp. D3-1R TaxID=3445778 RepID=UPI003F9F5EC9